MPLVRRSGSRALRAGLLVALCSALAAMSAPYASAQSSEAAALRSDAVTLSNRYFAALERVQSLDDEITHSQQLVDQLDARAKQARAAARARALLAYTS